MFISESNFSKTVHMKPEFFVNAWNGPEILANWGINLLKHDINLAIT